MSQAVATEVILEEYPQPLAGTYARLIDQDDALAQHNVLLPLFEVAVKYLTVAAVAQTIAADRPDADLSRALAALRHPSLGHWINLLRLIMVGRDRRQLPAASFIFPQFARLYAEPSTELPAAAALLRHLNDGRGSAKVSLRQLFDKLVEYRNDLAHGAGASTEDIEAITPLLQSALEEMLLAIPTLGERELRYLEAVEPQPSGEQQISILRLIRDRPRLRPQRETVAAWPLLAGQLYLDLPTGPLPLHPLLAFIRSCAECRSPQVGVINNATAKNVQYLCYACGHNNTLPDLAADVTAWLQRFDIATLPEAPNYAVPNNLPQQLTSFVGRQDEISAIRHLLDTHSLVTLTGPGGTGKSRISLRLGELLLDFYPDGVFFVPLAAVTDPKLVASSIAEALGVQEEAGTPLAETLKAYLREKQLLLLLDNFEQLTDAAPLLADLLAGSPLLKMIVTSRAALRIYGEQEYEVPPLALPDPRRLPPLAELAANEAVALFVERSRAVEPIFALTAANAVAVAEICARLDGLPLAIELAAARSKLLSPPELLARLSQRLKLLTGGARDRAPRQQTMRAAIAWSYDLLDDDERTLFRRLSVFAGWTMAAGEEVSEAAGPLDGFYLDLLDSLVDKSLVRRNAGAGGESRFLMLETIREYALELLTASGEADTLRGHHATYFLNLAEQAEPQLTGQQQAAWLNRLDQEIDNFRAAFEWSLGGGADGDFALRLGAALWRFWWRRGYLSEGARLISSALERGPSAAPLHRARALNGLGTLTMYQGDYIGAEKVLEDALVLWRQLDNPVGTDRALTVLGVINRDQGNFDKARGFFESSLTVRRGLGDKRLIAAGLNNLGVVAVDVGDYTQAEATYGESRQLLQQLGEQGDLAMVLNNLGYLAMLRHDFAEAGSLLDESLDLRRTLGDKFGIADCLQEMGKLAAEQALPERAARLWGAEEALRAAIGAPLPPADQEAAERYMATARNSISAADWQAAWAAGRNSSLEDTIAYALA